MASGLSLGDILESVTKTGRVSEIAVQRAYANWSDSRLGVMRGEINELGIEPIQVFGFAKAARKNAADIQLAIDIIDLAHVRPSIDVFVVVSGDGGFASLAKKLHEYGKTVIGCAYLRSANRVFQAVCDVFVPLPDPDAGRSPTAMSEGRVSAEVDAGTSRVVDQMKRSTLDPLTRGSGRNHAIDKTRQVLNWFESDRSCHALLDGEGIDLSQVSEAIRYAIPDFEVARMWFGKLREFLQYVCAGTELQVVQGPESGLRLARRGKGRDALPDLDDEYIHSEENYRSLLALAAPRRPSIIVPDTADDLSFISRWVATTEPKDTDLGTLIDDANNALETLGIGAASSKGWLLSFVASDIFDRSPPDERLANQTFTLKDRYKNDSSSIIGCLKDVALGRLTDIFGDGEKGRIKKTVDAIIPG